MNQEVIKGLLLTVNCMKRITNVNWFKLVEQTQKLEDEFRIAIRHGIGFNLGKIVGPTAMGHGDINVLRHFLSTGTFSSNCKPWQCLIVGVSRQLIEFLKYLALMMNSWLGDDKGFAESGYPVPLMISSVVKWNEKLGECCEFSKIANDANSIHIFLPRGFPQIVQKTHVLSCAKNLRNLVFLWIN